MSALETDAAPIMVREGALREGPDGWVLVGSRGQQSGHVSFPPRDDCPESLETTVDRIDLPQTGTLFAHTTVHMPSAHFKPPYQVGYVDLDDGGPRVFAPLDGDSLRIGDRMALKVEPMWEEDGVPVIAYRFVKTGERDA